MPSFAGTLAGLSRRLGPAAADTHGPLGVDVGFDGVSVGLRLVGWPGGLGMGTNLLPTENIIGQADEYGSKLTTEPGVDLLEDEVQL